MHSKGPAETVNQSGGVPRGCQVGSYSTPAEQDVTPRSVAQAGTSVARGASSRRAATSRWTGSLIGSGLCPYGRTLPDATRKGLLTRQR